MTFGRQRCDDLGSEEEEVRGAGPILMSTGLSIGESTYDTAKKTFTGWMEGPDMTGNIMKARSVNQHTAANTRVFTLYGPGPDGKEMQMMKITDTRRK